MSNLIYSRILTEEQRDDLLKDCKYSFQIPGVDPADKTAFTNEIIGDI